MVLFEMLTGQPPFQGNFDQAIIYSILHEKPKSLKKLNPEVSDELEQLVLSCLEKDRKKRLQSAEELLSKLNAIKCSGSVSTSTKFSASRLQISKAGLVISTIIAAVLIILAALLPIKKIFNPVNVEELTRQLDTLVSQRKYFAAYDLAKEYQDGLKANPLFKELSLFIYDTLSNATEPEGAKVFLKRFDPSISMLQRRLRIGYTRAARLIESMQERGIVGPNQPGSQGLEVLDYGPAAPPVEEQGD